MLFRYRSEGRLVCYLENGTYWTSLIPKHILDDLGPHTSTYVSINYQMLQYGLLLEIVFFQKDYSILKLSIN